KPLFYAAILVFVAAGFGRWLRTGDITPFSTSKPTLVGSSPQIDGPLVAGLQPNIPQGQRMRGHRDPKETMFEILQIHERLLREVRPLEPDLLVWSETSFYPVNEPAEPIGRLIGEGAFKDPEAPGGRRPMRDLVLPGPDQVTILGSIRRTALPPSEKGGPL